MTYEPPAPVIVEGHDADVVTAEWRRRTEAEYTSAAIAQQVTLWLIQLGAPPDLIRDGLRVVDDELTHSELSTEVAEHAGGDAGRPLIDPSSLMLAGAGAGDPSGALVSAIVRFFCIGETLAVPLFRMLRAQCSVPVALRALDRVLKDEARHRQFGWDVLDWALLAGGASVRDALADQAPGMLDEVAAAYGVGNGDGSGVAPKVRAWGLAPPADYSSTVSAALTSDVLPRLAARGIELA